MRLKRLVVMMIVLTLLTTGTVRPRPAQATSTTELVILIVGGMAAYAAFIILGAYWVYGNAFPSSSGEDMDEGMPGEPPSPTVHFAQHCKQGSANITLLCW